MKQSYLQWEWNDLKDGEDSSSLGGILKPALITLPSSGKQIIVSKAPPDDKEVMREFWRTVSIHNVS